MLLFFYNAGPAELREMATEQVCQQLGSLQAMVLYCQQNARVHYMVCWMLVDIGMSIVYVISTSYN